MPWKVRQRGLTTSGSRLWLQRAAARVQEGQVINNTADADAHQFLLPETCRCFLQGNAGLQVSYEVNAYTFKYIQRMKKDLRDLLPTRLLSYSTSRMVVGRRNRVSLEADP